jgi:glucan phosphoethanolaminetransferase (alkaline phosphatase superfamily)
LLVTGVLLSTITTNAQAELIRRRQDSCDGTIPLPTSAYVFGFAGLAVGALTVFLLLRWFRHSRQPVVLVLFATAAAAVIFEIFALVTAFQEGRPMVPMCGG